MAASNNENIEYAVTYMQCLRNHAAHTIYYVVDGCGLFEASGPNGTPEAMVCAACQCHRNFHKTVVVELPSHFNTQGTNTGIDPVQPDQPQIAVAGVQEQIHDANNHARGPVIEMNMPPQMAQNWIRQRITPEQSERLRIHAERNNWKMFREYSREDVGRICLEVGIIEVTFKRWINYHRRRRMANNAI
ncbi:hypothetical protein CDL12_17583 [Handroanthus impetiginosus]|uniref:ZF-HD dimerization-type domain-containing protein n=1 Tax=Handroanthus impetiginosus TaxID=429701 RepID=A0A2G9GX15_9LAMI|nr:hypothetical protein CDL12_17583 [Handroanthus impetiginosus]